MKRNGHPIKNRIDSQLLNNSTNLEAHGKLSADFPVDFSSPHFINYTERLDCHYRDTFRPATAYPDDQFDEIAQSNQNGYDDSSPNSELQRRILKRLPPPM